MSRVICGHAATVASEQHEGQVQDAAQAFFRYRRDERFGMVSYHPGLGATLLISAH